MTKLAILIAVGLAAGFAVTAGAKPANACSCIPAESWTLTLVDAPPEIDRAPWADGAYFRAFGDDYEISANNGVVRIDLVPR